MRDKYSGNAKETLYGIANNRPTKLDDYVKTGKHTKACDLAISVLSLVEKREGSSDSEVSIFRLLGQDYPENCPKMSSYNFLVWKDAIGALVTSHLNLTVVRRTGTCHGKYSL